MYVFSTVLCHAWLRELWRPTQSFPNQDLFSQQLAQKLEHEVLSIPQPCSLSLLVNLSSSLNICALLSALSDVGVLRLCGPWGRHYIRFLGFGFLREPWVTPLVLIGPSSRSYVQEQSFGGLRGGGFREKVPGPRLPNQLSSCSGTQIRLPHGLAGSSPRLPVNSLGLLYFPWRKIQMYFLVFMENNQHVFFSSLQWVVVWGMNGLWQF